MAIDRVLQAAAIGEHEPEVHQADHLGLVRGQDEAGRNPEADVLRNDDVVVGIDQRPGGGGLAAEGEGVEVLELSAEEGPRTLE